MHTPVVKYQEVLKEILDDPHCNGPLRARTFMALMQGGKDESFNKAIALCAKAERCGGEEESEAAIFKQAFASSWSLHGKRLLKEFPKSDCANTARNFIAESEGVETRFRKPFEDQVRCIEESKRRQEE